MLLTWLERVLTFKPDAKEYSDLSPFSFQVIERGDSRESTILYSKIRAERPLIVFAHGNTGNVSRCTWYFEQFEKLNLSYVAFDFPGYGKAKGYASEESFYRSGKTVVEYLKKERDVAENEIIFYGVSLGGAIATELSTQFNFCGVILESVFTDSHSMGKRLVPYLPVQLLFPNRFNNRGKIHKVQMPLLLLHGTDDQTTPASMGLEIFDLHPGPKEKMIIEGGQHREVGRIAGDIYLKRLLSFIQHSYANRKPESF